MGEVKFSDLYKDVIDAGRCTGCSACVVACPYYVLGYEDERPFMKVDYAENYCPKGEGHGCTVCADVCPQLHDLTSPISTTVFGRERRDDEPYGIFNKIVAARSRDAKVLKHAQDGGAITSLLSWGLSKGRIDGVATSSSERVTPWVPTPRLATTPEELLQCAGSKYTYSPNLRAIRDGLLRDLQKLAVVGNPCQSSGARQMMLMGPKVYGERIKLIIGFLCTETFDFGALMEQRLRRQVDVRIEDISKMNVKGKLIVDFKDREKEIISIKELKTMQRKACAYCNDFSAEYSDIAAGGLGGTEGWTILLARTKTGAEFLQGALDDGVLETKDVDGDEFKPQLETLRKLAVAQRKRPRWESISAVSPVP